jgi:hypothetical protein
MAVRTEWDAWWESRGHRDLSLLLWAVWNRIGTCPLDEYESYGPALADVLRKAHEIDEEPIPEAGENEAQRARNTLRTETVDLLTTMLGAIRTTAMELSRDDATDMRAASLLFDWHEWSTGDLQRRSPG